MKKTTLEYIHRLLEDEAEAKMRVWCEASDKYFDHLNLEGSGEAYHKELSNLRYDLNDAYNLYTMAMYALREFRAENF